MPTQLDLSAKALAKVRTVRAIYCRVCEAGHIVGPEQLWLGSEAPGVHPLAGTPWARWRDGGAPHASAAPGEVHEPRMDVSGEPILSPKRSPIRSKDLTPR